MSSFIRQISSFITAQNHPIHQWVIVVPSQRSVRYIQKELFESTNKPMLSPKIITINRFFETISPKQIIDKTRLLFELFKIHESTTSSDNKTFDDFYTWGKTLLSDFNEIDSYLVESKQLFKNLRDIKEIENWSFNSEELTETQLKFIQFWEELGVYFAAFEKTLADKNTAYMGKAVKEICNNIDWIFKRYPNEKFLFAGFNAHSPAELSVIKQLMLLGKASILFDADQYYINNGLHEAGAFIRKNLNTLGIPKQSIEFKNKLSQKEITFNIITCAQTTGQVKVAASILEELSEEQITTTLILLAEEDLLVPLLKNIPSKVQKANITLGLSLNNSILKTWVDLIFKIQKALQNQKAAYHKDIFELCFHSFMEEILTHEEKQELVQLETTIKKNNLIYIDPNKLTLPEKLKPIFQLIYTDWNADWLAGIHTIRQISSHIYSFLKDENEYEKALLETFDNGIIDLQNCLTEAAPQMSLATFKNIFTQHYANLSIAYFGNPIDGLQIMGLLETRMLDFKRIIVIGMNEKNMPPSNQINSLIPMDLRSYFNMPTVREKQGIFAHHFYRLLHEAEEVYITYSASNSSDMNSSEKSRYIMQLELELPQINPKATFLYKDYTIDNTQVDVRPFSIQKNEYNLQLIESYLQKGISASALGAFYQCPLDFFYKYILKFRDETRVEEDIEANTFGSLIHEALENLYTPFINHTLTTKPIVLKSISKTEIELFKKHIDHELHIGFKKHFNSENAFKTGKNRLTFEMSKKLSNSFLNYEINHLNAIQSNIYVEALEEKLTAEIPNILLGETGKTITLRLNGIIDRIDFHNGGYHIIDYKTGKVDYTKLRIKELTPQSLYAKCLSEKKFLQLYFYLYLFYQTYKTYPVSITFISFITLHKVESTVDEGGQFEQMILLFPEVIQLIINDIFDTKNNFSHIQKGLISYCNFC